MAQEKAGKMREGEMAQEREGKRVGGGMREERRRGKKGGESEQGTRENVYISDRMEVCRGEEERGGV